MTEETFSDFVITLAPMAWVDWIPLPGRNNGNGKKQPTKANAEPAAPVSSLSPSNFSTKG
jgi:hypothetical protein